MLAVRHLPGAARRGELAVIVESLECVFSSSDRCRVASVAEQLRQAGIVAVFGPSHRRIRTWDVDVPTDDASRARSVVEENSVS
jgi:hypothetical protein